MAVRVRSDGRVLCAAMHPAEPGDRYLDDGVHYALSVELRVLVTEPMDLPAGVGIGGLQPAAAAIDPFYDEGPACAGPSVHPDVISSSS